MRNVFKKHLKKLLVAGLSISLLTGLTGCGKSPEEKAEKFVTKITKKLELDESQQVLLTTLKDNALSAALNLKSKKRDLHEDFIDLISLNRIEEDQLYQLTDANLQQLEASIKMVVPSFVAFHASLNEEQKQQVATFLEKRRKDKH